MKGLISAIWIVVGMSILIFGCQEQGTTPSEPGGSRTGVLVPADQDLAQDIHADIKCLFEGGEQNAMTNRFLNAVRKKEAGQTGSLEAMTGEQLNDLFEAYENDELNETPDGACADGATGETTDQVLARLMANLSAFGGHGDTALDSAVVAEALEEEGTIFSFRLEEGTTELTNDMCVGLSVPAQTTNEGFNTCAMWEPSDDPGFEEFGVGTAPYWLEIHCTFEGPYDPQVFTAWHVIDNDGDFSKDSSEEAPPEGAALEACTIREGALLCDGDVGSEGDSLTQTVGELPGDALACQLGGSASTRPEAIHRFVNRLFEPFAGFVDVRPLYANPGALGLKSSFTSPFGVTFEEDGEIAGSVINEIAFSTDRGTTDGSFNIWGVGCTPPFGAASCDGSDLRQITTGTPQEFTVKVSPDGSKIAYEVPAFGGFEIWIRASDGSTGAGYNLTLDAGDDRLGAWTPDGSRIVFSSDRDGDQEIYAIEIDGTNLVQLTNNAAIDRGPDVHVFGGLVAFASNRDGNFEIYTMHIDGTNQIRLTNRPFTADVSPSWGPGIGGPGSISDLVFQSQSTTNRILRTSGTAPEAAVTDLGEGLAPDWGVYGIAFIRTGVEGGNDVWVMNVDGTDATNLTQDSGTATAPSWGPGT